MADAVMIPKPEKSINEVTSYMPISLLPIISELSEKLPIKRIKSGRMFKINYEDEYSTVKEIFAGVPQGSVLGPVLT